MRVAFERRLLAAEHTNKQTTIPSISTRWGLGSGLGIDEVGSQGEPPRTMGLSCSALGVLDQGYTLNTKSSQVSLQLSSKRVCLGYSFRQDFQGKSSRPIIFFCFSLHTSTKRVFLDYELRQLLEVRLWASMIISKASAQRSLGGACFG